MNWEKMKEERDNFILVKERSSTRGFLGPVVVRTSGYAHKSIAPKKVPKVYLDRDCSVFTLYLKPGCKMRYAQREFADFFEYEFCKPLTKKGALIGYSEGATFLAGLTKFLRMPTSILLIDPKAKQEEQVDFSKLSKHNVMLIVPKDDQKDLFIDTVVKDVLKKDGLKRIEIPANLIKKTIITKTKGRALNSKISYFLYDAFF